MKNRKNYSTNITFNYIGRFVKPYRFIFSLFLLVAFISMAIEVLQAYFVRNLVDIALSEKRQELVYLIIIIAATITIGFFIQYMNRLLYGYFSGKMLRDIRSFGLNHLIKLPTTYFQNNHSGDIISRFTTDLSTFQTYMENEVYNIFSQIVLFVVATIYMAIISTKLLIVSIMFTPVTLVLICIFGKNIGIYSRRTQEYIGRATAKIKDVINGISMVKMCNIEEHLYEKYEEDINGALENRLKNVNISVYMSPLQVILRMLPSVICIIYGSYLVINNDITTGQLISFTFLLSYIVWPLAFLPDMITGTKNAFGAVTRLFDIFELDTERVSGEAYSCSDKEAVMEFNKVNFSYSSKKITLKDISFKIGSGKKLAIVGASGSGKSTIFKLLCGFFNNIEAHVYVYGELIKDWNLEALRSQIAFVAQETFLFPLTIYENISYGKKGASKEEVVNAAKVANAHEFIMSLPKGYNTVITEGGLNLSGGQRQRIGIARAIIKDSPIILLDEPTSALDNESEKFIQETLDRVMKNKTVIIIAHRLSTIRNVDEILVLDNGEVIEKGTHEQLMKNAFAYKALFQKQFLAN
jgi:ABC-type multidrug transport system fused ATPase/permease subunit